jgi:hypothetical protein
VSLGVTKLVTLLGIIISEFYYYEVNQQPKDVVHNCVGAFVARLESLHMNEDIWATDIDQSVQLIQQTGSLNWSALTNRQ